MVSALSVYVMWMVKDCLRYGKKGRKVMFLSARRAVVDWREASHK